MDIKSSRSEMAAVDNQSLADVLSTGYKSPNIKGNRNNKDRGSINNDLHPSKPRLSFKRTYEEMTSREKEISQDQKIQLEKSSDKENLSDSVQSQEGVISSNAGYGGDTVHMNPNPVNPDTGDMNLSGATLMVQEEIEIGLITNVESWASDLSSSTKSDGILVVNAASSLKGLSAAENCKDRLNMAGEKNELPQNSNKNLAGGVGISAAAGMSQEDTPIGDLVVDPAKINKTTMNANSKLGNLPSSTVSGEHQGASLAEALGGTTSAPSEGEFSSPASLHPHPLSGKTFRKSEGGGSGYLPKGIDQNFTDSKPDLTEAEVETLLSSSADHTENQGDRQPTSFNRDFNSFMGSSGAEQLVNGRSVYRDARSINGKSGEFKVVDPQILMNSIVEGGGEIISKGSGRVKMTLNPPNLGSLDMDIRVRNNKVDVTFIADTPEVQQSLQANTDLLKAALNQQGLKIDGYAVLLQGSMDSNPGNYSGENTLWQNARRETGSGQSGKEMQIQEEVVPNWDPRRQPASMENGKISLFI